MWANSVSNLQPIEELDFLFYLSWHTQNKFHLAKNFGLLNAIVQFSRNDKETKISHVKINEMFFFHQ